MKKLLQNRNFRIVFVLGLIVATALAIAVTTLNYTLGRLRITQVTATQMAAAMREDHFWYTYRFDTLLFDGKVADKTNINGHLSAKLQTSDSYSVTCELPSGVSLNVDKTYSFAAVANQADRQPAGVLLHRCVIL